MYQAFDYSACLWMVCSVVLIIQTSAWNYHEDMNSVNSFGGGEPGHKHTFPPADKHRLDSINKSPWKLKNTKAQQNNTSWAGLTRVHTTRLTTWVTHTLEALMWACTQHGVAEDLRAQNCTFSQDKLVHAVTNAQHQLAHAVGQTYQSKKLGGGALAPTLSHHCSRVAQICWSLRSYLRAPLALTSTSHTFFSSSAKEVNQWL